jgi:glycerol-3-phosphate acyltransferase PlsY
MLKGFIPVYIAKNILMEKVGIFSPKDVGLIVIVAVLGHCFSIFMKFKGGKGVATALGVMLALSPQATLIIVLFWLGVFLTTGYVSLASILSAYISWFIYFFIEIKNFTSPDYIYIVIAIFISSMIIIYKHISNIQRLLNGTENRFIYTQKEDER